MRLLLTTALTATLMGCSFAPQQTARLSKCTDATAFACSDAASLKMNSKALHGEVIAANFSKQSQSLHCDLHDWDPGHRGCQGMDNGQA